MSGNQCAKVLLMFYFPMTSLITSDKLNEANLPGHYLDIYRITYRIIINNTFFLSKVLHTDSPELLYRRGDNQTPCAIFFDTLDVTLGGQLFQLFVYSCDVDAYLFGQALDCNVGSRIHKVQNLAC